MSKPTKKKLKKYLEKCENGERLPTQEGFRAYCNMGREAYARWQTEHEERAEMIHDALTDAVWNSPKQATLIGAYMKEHETAHDSTIRVVFAGQTEGDDQ